MQQWYATGSLIRDTSYSQINQDDVDYFSDLLGERAIIQDEAALEPMNRCADVCTRSRTGFKYQVLQHIAVSGCTIQFVRCRDWMGKYVGKSKLALKPSTTEQVSQVLAYCSLRRLAVVPQGGNTGLVGGSVPVFDEIVLNMSNMNKIHSFDEVGPWVTPVCSMQM